MKSNITKINKILKSLELQKNILQNKAKAKIAKTVVQRIPKSTLSYSTLVFNSFLKLFKSLINYWFIKLNSYRILRTIFKIAGFILTPLLKLYNIFKILKFGRAMLAFILFFIGLNIDVNNFWIGVPTIINEFTFSWDWFNRFFNVGWISILAASLTIVEKLYHLLYGLYNRNSNLMESFEPIDTKVKPNIKPDTKFDTDINSDVYKYHEDLLRKKNEFYELSKWEDKPWYTKKWVWFVGGITTVVVIGGIGYILYGDKISEYFSKGDGRP